MRSRESDQFEAEVGNILPIAIRPNLTVRIQGVPHDLTQAEANKIMKVITALVSTSDT